MRKMHFLVKRFLLSASAVALLEYSMGFALLGLAVIVGTTSSGTAIKEYIFCIAIGGCDTQNNTDNKKTDKR